MDRRDDVESQHVLRLMARFADDLAANRERTLEDYLAEFPSQADAVRAAYAEFQSEDTRSADDLPSFGPYQLEGEIGRGGHGVVYRARDTRLGRLVAVKMLTEGASQSPEMRRRLAREAEAASKLDHPGICSVYDVGETAGVPYIAMRYVEGQTLAALIKAWREARGENDTVGSNPSGSEERARMKRAIRLIEGATRALATAHDAKLVHRDIKPGNIMVTEGDAPVLLDFGVVRREEVESQVLTRSGEVIGTPAYMPPEQLRGDRGAVDHRADLYSLGATLYECVTLERPFSGPTLESLFADIVSTDPPNPARLNAAVWPDLAAVLDVALDKRPERRYQSAEDLADDLERLAENRPVSVRAAGPLLRLRRWYEQKPAVAFGVTAAFAILVVGLAATLYFLDRSIREGQRADRKTAEYERLSDTENVEALVREADELWPAVPARIADLERWIRRAEGLRDRLPEHRASLERLRARAQPADDAERERRTAGDRATLERLRAQRDAAAQELAIVDAEVDRVDTEMQRLETDEDSRAAAMLPAYRKSRTRLEARKRRLEDAPEQLDAQIGELERRLASAHRWHFTHDVDQWLHAELTAMVAQIERLVGEDKRDAVTVHGIRRRLAWARSVKERSIDRHRALWDGAIERIRSNARYRDLVLAPQLGLVPLGPDPRSGLEEFAHLQSGRPPVRSPDTGALAIGAETCIVLVLLPGGSVTLGASEDEAFGQLNERQYRAHLRPFFVGKWEVTQGQFARVMNVNPSYFSRPTEYDGGDEVGPLNPAEQVDWHRAMAFARRLDLALPTESQWEYACRGGSRASYAWGASRYVLRGRDNVKDQAASRYLQDDARAAKWDDGFAQHAPITSRIFKPNRFGLYAMHGNVSEWCRDWYTLFRVVDADAPGDGRNRAYHQSTTRAFRGGSWMLSPPLCRAAMRWSIGPTATASHLGLRVVRPVSD